jgi:acetolactate synthase-1/2/3 large subunit
MKYSDFFMDVVKGLGFTHCFYVGGGNSMHLLESASSRFSCIPVVHEVTAAISSEYFNQSNMEGGKAFALVTAGPGFTNLVTGIAGSWLDSRELLVIGGQAKSTNLAKGTVRQLGHQEIDGVSVAFPITKVSKRIDKPWNKKEIVDIVSKSWQDRPGPVFIEVCLDLSAQEMEFSILDEGLNVENSAVSELDLKNDSTFVDLLVSSKRPLILLGGGVKREAASQFLKTARKHQIPVACTWTGADRVGTDYKFYAGRPNTYGMRWANVFQQQSDLLIAVGTSLGFQQTGFNVEEYLPVGQLVHVDIDRSETKKTWPKSRYSINADSGKFLAQLVEVLEDYSLNYPDWSEFLELVKLNVPLVEECQNSRPPYVSPHQVMTKVQDYLSSEDCIVAASSGGTFTAAMQVISVKGNQVFLGNKGLASMGYGLAGAIGCALARPDSKTVLFEGDGGFAQNLQDLGTVAANDLNIKIFITCNDGYASIRTSQKNYFKGHYLGCDRATGLYLPDWALLAESFGIPSTVITGEDWESDDFRKSICEPGPQMYLIMADPDQMYLPKIFSRVDSDGRMSSTPLHDMSPSLSEEVSNLVFKYIQVPKS